MAHRLCVSKGRLLPSYKEEIIGQALQLTKSTGSVPNLNMTVPLPGSKEAETHVGVFEEFYSQIHGKHSLRAARGGGSETQLWKVRMHGAGATALWTDQQDAGGMYRASVGQLCEHLQRPPSGVEAAPLLEQTRNFAMGLGEGDDAMERWLPNPALSVGDEGLLKKFEFIGQLMGASCRTSGFIEIDFAPIVFKQILGERATYHDIAACDARAAAPLASAATEMTEEAWAEQQASDSRTYWMVQLASGRAASLRGDGKVPVGYSERQEFVEKATAAWLAPFVPFFKAVRRGFFETFPELASRLLTWRELERRVCGFPDVSVEALQRIARFEGSYNASDEYMKDFFGVLRGFSGAERKQFLGFVWGRGRLPAHPTQCAQPFPAQSVTCH